MNCDHTYTQLIFTRESETSGKTRRICTECGKSWIPAETPQWRKKFDEVLLSRPVTAKVGVEFCAQHNRWEERWTFQGVTNKLYT